MFTCDDLLDKVAKLLPEVLETLESYARFHPWAEGFVRGVLELPVEDLLITCHEETIALGSRSRVEAVVDAITSEATLEDGREVTVICFFGIFLELYSRYSFTSHEQEIDAILRSVIAHELMHAYLFRFQEYGEEIPEKIEEALSRFAPLKFASDRASIGWLGEGVSLASKRGRLRLFPTYSDFAEFTQKLLPKLELRRLRLKSFKGLISSFQKELEEKIEKI